MTNDAHDHNVARRPSFGTPQHGTGVRPAVRASAARLVLAFLLAVVLLAGAVILLALQDYTVRGIVAGAGGPVSGAVVRIRGTENQTTTGTDGAFVLTVRGLGVHRTVTAWKEGYYTAAANVPLAGGRVALALRPYTERDHPEVGWLPSDPDPTAKLACGNCHVELHEQWREDAHSDAATNPLVLAFYNGTGVQGEPGAGPGFRQDFPDQVGNCAACHAPGAAVVHPEGVDLNQVDGEARNGVFCQFCHSIHGAQAPSAETTAGVHSLDIRRPADGQHLFVGPYDDVPGRDTFSPLQRESQLCAACHSGGWWNVPAYESFDEWQASDYAAEGVQCQDCHMPADGQLARDVSACAPGLPRPGFGETLCRAQGCVACHLLGQSAEDADPLAHASLVPARDPATIFSHAMPGARDESFLRRAVTMVVTATQGIDGVLVDVALTNTGAGHHVPTDSPLRNMILLVTARDAQGHPLPYLGRQVVPTWGSGLPTPDHQPPTANGHLTPDNGQPSADAIRNTQYAIRSTDYAGLPGKGFARILEDYEGNAPAPPWRNGIHVLSDNRIPARATDRSSYPFALPEGGEVATVEVRLIYRRVFKAWADEKGLDLPDVVMAEATTTATPVEHPVVASLPTTFNTELFAPSPATTASGERLPHGALSSPGACTACHAQPIETTLDVATEQSGISPVPEAGMPPGAGHGAATNSPLYRAWYNVASQNVQGQMGAFCAGCHTPVGLLTGQIRTRWGWDGLEEYPLDEAARAGVSCDVCHSIVATTGTGNGAYVVAPEGSVPPNDLGAHRARYDRDLYAQPEFCATCHEATNPSSGLPVMTTYTEWRESRFNTGKPATSTTCQDCHFADGRHGELRIEDLQGAARVELLAPDDAPAGAEVALQVRVSNVGAGHDLPTGMAELRKLWLEVTVTDAVGRTIFTSGATDDFGDPVEGSVTYGTTWRDAEGRPTDRMWEAESILRDDRIAAGMSALEDYRFVLPEETVGPLRVRAALKYRSVGGYLSSLMTIYLKEEVPAAPTIEMAADEGMISMRP